MSWNEDIGMTESVSVGIQPPSTPVVAVDEYAHIPDAPPATFPPKEGPVRPYRTVISDSGNDKFVNRLLIGTASTGLVRIEWHQGRTGQMTPTNWSNVQMLQFMSGFHPLHYQVADAQNLIVREAIENDFEHLLLWEHDMIPLPDASIRLNEYMSSEKVPVVSGFYYTRSMPSEPLVYRGRGTGPWYDYKIGDRVWADGVPTGFLLIHMSILRAMWDESEEYEMGNTWARRVFETPRRVWYDPASDQYNALTGTSDLEWCTRVMKGDYFRKAGWKNYADKPFPFLVDTNIPVAHINPDGAIFPPGGFPKTGEPARRFDFFNDDEIGK